MPYNQEMDENPAQQFPAIPLKNDNLSPDDGDLAELKSSGLLSEPVGRDEVEGQTIELERTKMIYKRQTQPSYTHRVLESISDGTGIFAATQAGITAFVPNPATAAAAVITGIVSAVTGTIAKRIDK